MWKLVSTQTSECATGALIHDCGKDGTRCAATPIEKSIGKLRHIHKQAAQKDQQTRYIRAHTHFLTTAKIDWVLLTGGAELRNLVCVKIHISLSVR